MRSDTQKATRSRDISTSTLDKKAGKLHYGYKKHFLSDDNGLVLTVRTTAANQHDSKSLEPLIKNSDLSPAPCPQAVGSMPIRHIMSC